MCEHSTQVHYYHDGRLTAQSRGEVEAHLRACPECAALLADLRKLSALVASAPRAQISLDALARLRAARDIVRDRGVLRIASWLTAAAAAIVLAVLLIQPTEQLDRGDTASAAGVWQTRAVMSPEETGDGNSAELVVMAQWMADELAAADSAGGGSR
jgi:anti-sigma factor RsiW